MKRDLSSGVEKETKKVRPQEEGSYLKEFEHKNSEMYSSVISFKIHLFLFRTILHVKWIHVSLPWLSLQCVMMLTNKSVKWIQLDFFIKVTTYVAKAQS